eukprot:gene3888-7101_t
MTKFEYEKFKSHLNLANTKLVSEKRAIERELNPIKNKIVSYMEIEKEIPKETKMEYGKLKYKFDAHEILLSKIEFLAIHSLHVKKSKKCPDSLMDAVATTIYASTRIKLRELLEIRRQLTLKYGQTFALSSHGNKKNEVNEEFFDKFECKDINENILDEMMDEIAFEEKIKYKDYDPKFELDIETIGFMTPNYKKLDEESQVIIQDLQNKFEKFKEFIVKLQQVDEEEEEEETIKEMENEYSDEEEYIIKLDSKVVVETKLHVENSFQSEHGENIFYQYWLPEQEVDYQPKRMAMITYEFDAQDAIELSVKCEEEVKVIEDRGDGWSMVSKGVKSGLIPTNYYQEFIKDKKKKVAKVDKVVRGKVIIQHTIGEHGSRYNNLVNQLLKNGYAVFAMDLVGHGKSDGNRCYVRNFADWSTDFSKFYEIVEQTIAGDMFIFGQGIGGPIAYSYLSSHMTSLRLKEMEPTAIILSGATFEFCEEFKNQLKEAVGNKRSSSIPVPCKLDIDSMVTAGDNFSWKNDKLCFTGEIPTKTCSQLILLADSVNEMFEKNTTPFYILHGENDEIAKAEIMKKVYKSSKVEDAMKQMAIIPGLKHDLLHEDDDIRDGLTEDIIDWIKIIQE